MAKLISSKDIFEDEDVFKGIRDSANKTIADLTKLESQMQKTASEIKASLGGQKLDNTQSLKDFTQATEQATKMTKEMVKIEQEKAKLLAISEKAEREVIRTQQLREKEAQKLAKATANEASAYKQLEKATREAKNEAREMASQLLALEKAGKKNSDEFKDLSNQYRESAKRAAEMDKELKAIDESVGDNFRKVGSYKQELRKLMEEMMRMDQSSEAFKVAQKRAADLKDEISDLAQETKANAGNAFEQLSNNTQMFGSRLLDLDLAGAGKALTGMGNAVRGIDFKLLGQETKALASGFLDLAKAILSNPIFILGAVVAGIAMNYRELYAWMTDANGEMARQNQLKKELNAELEKELSNTAEEVTRIEVLTSRVKDHNLSEKDRREALGLLSKLYPEYFANLDGDINNTNALTNAKARLIAKLTTEAKARAAQNLLEEQYAKKLALEIKVNEGKAKMGADKFNEALSDARDNSQTLFKETNQAISEWWNGTEGLGQAALELEKVMANIADIEKVAADAVIAQAKEEVKAVEKTTKVEKKANTEKKIDRKKLLDNYLKEDDTYASESEQITQKQLDAETKAKEAAAKKQEEDERQARLRTVDLATAIGDKEIQDEKNRIAKLKQQEAEKRAIIEQSVKLATDFYVKQSQKKAELLGEELAEAEKQADALQRLAESGNISAKESLAEQQRIIAEKEMQREKELKKQQRIQMAQSVFSAYSANVENDPNTAVAKTIQDATLLTQFVNSLPAFEKGTEDTGTNGRGIDGKGGFLSVLHPNERVVPKSLNERIGALSNEELSRIAWDYQNGKVVRDGDAVATPMETLLLVSKIDELTQTIKNKPETNIQLGSITQSMMEVVHKTKVGNTVTYNRFKINK